MAVAVSGGRRNPISVIGYFFPVNVAGVQTKPSFLYVDTLGQPKRAANTESIRPAVVDVIPLMASIPYQSYRYSRNFLRITNVIDLLKNEPGFTTCRTALLMPGWTLYLSNRVIS